MLAIKQWDFKEHSLDWCFKYSHKCLSSRSYIYLEGDELLVVLESKGKSIWIYLAKYTLISNTFL